MYKVRIIILAHTKESHQQAFYELCKLILCFLCQSLCHEHLSFFPPHFIAFTTPFSSLFLIFPSLLFTLFHLYGFFLLLCISINNYSFEIHHFIHLHSSNLPLTLPFSTYADNKKPPPVSDPSTVIYPESNSDNF